MINFDEAMSFINSFDRLGKPVSDLNRMTALLSLLGNPHKHLKFIHIAGTNGKGSVAQMCSEILIDAGYRVGLFTSPYIIDYTDRIKVGNNNIPEKSLCEIVEQVKKVTDSVEYRESFSQFEITNAIAFLYYRKIHCDIVVLEVGIGGRLDSTNVITAPLVSIITSISYDHTAILGETLKDIAFHKAGIIKKGCPCVLSVNNPQEVVEVIQKEALHKISMLMIPDNKKLRVIHSGIMGSDIFYDGKPYRIKMSGEHQIINALSVIEAMNILIKKGMCISYRNIFNGIKSAVVPARAEVLSTEPIIILDGAHNQAGMSSLGSILSKIDCTPKIAVIGMVRDKNARESIKQILPYISEFICVDGFAANAVPAGELADIIKSLGKNAFEVYDIDYAISEAKEIINDAGLLVICGSLYLASTARKIYLK